MRIDRNTEPMLYLLNEVRNGRFDISSLVNNYDYSTINKVLRNFNVEFVSNGFVNVLKSNQKKLYDSFKGKNLYKLLGDCSGINVIDDAVVLYDCTPSGLSLILFPRYAKQTNYSNRFDVYYDNKRINSSSDKGYYIFQETILALLMKKYCPIETIKIGKGIGRRMKDGEMVVNKLPFMVSHLDCSWFRTIIRTEGFGVKGHFRLQAIGEEWSDHRLIYIKPFQKHGYTRTARKVVYERRLAA